MRPLNVSAIGEFESTLHAIEVTQDGFKPPPSTNTSTASDDFADGGGCGEPTPETLGQQGNQCPRGQELTDINQCLFHPDPGDSTSSVLDASEKVAAHPHAGKWHRLGFRRHPYLDEFRLDLETVQPKRCLPADRGFGATQQQRCPRPLLECVKQWSRVVKPLRRSHHVTLDNQALERLVPDANQVGLFDRDEPLLRPDQLPEFAGKILPPLHSRMIGEPAGIASASDAPVDNTADHHRLSPKTPASCELDAVVGA